MHHVAAEAAEQARPALQANGFAVISEFFSRAEVREVEILLDDMFCNLEGRPAVKEAHSRVFQRLGRDSAAGETDYCEVFYPASLEPRLIGTPVFVRCAALAASLGNSYSMYFNSVIVKPPHSQTSILWHRDGDYSPFRIFGTAAPRLSFWIPLQDTSVENGGLQYIAGSHKQRRTLHVPEKSCVACTIPVGGVAIHTPRTLHCSGGNASDQRRAAWLLTFGKFGAYKLAVKRLFGRIPQPLDT